MTKESLLCQRHPVPCAPATPRRREQGPAPRERCVLRPRARPLTSRPLGQLLVQVPQAPLEGRSLWAFRAQGWLLRPRPALAAEVRAPVFPPHRGLSSVGPGRGLRPCQCRSGPTRTWGTRSATEAGGSTHLPSHVGNRGHGTGRQAPPCPWTSGLGGGESWVLGSWTAVEPVSSGSAQGPCIPRPPRPWSPQRLGLEEHVSLPPLEHTWGPQSLSPLHRCLKARGTPGPAGPVSLLPGSLAAAPPPGVQASSSQA